MKTIECNENLYLMIDETMDSERPYVIASRDREAANEER